MKMNSYYWSGLSAKGEKISGLLDAPTLRLAKLYLTEKNITPFTVHRKYLSLLMIKKPKIQTRDIALFFRQFSTLIHAGISLVRCCQILAASQSNPALKNVITQLQKNLAAGQQLSVSLRELPYHFDTMSYHLIAMSEQTGKLDEILLQIANHKEKMQQLKHQVQQALLYPAIITIIATSVTLVMLIFIVPKFAELFQTLQGELPFFTRCIIYLSKIILNEGWLISLPLTLIFFFRTHLIQFQLKIPIFGNLHRKIILTRFARNLFITLQAGVPLLEALRLIAPTLGNSFYENIVKLMGKDIASGQSLGYVMRKFAFPDLMIQLTEVGEESGQMEQMQEKIAQTYETEIELFVSRLSTLLEPLIITILGVLIGCIVIALYLPIFKLGTVI